MNANASVPLATSDAATGWYRLVRRIGVDLREGEGAKACLLFVYFFLIIAFQYASKSVRQSTLIDNLGAKSLPIVFLIVALCSIPALLLYSRLVDRLPRHRLIAATSVVVAGSMAGFWWLYQFEAAWIRVAFYVWVSIVYVLNVSQFWSFSNHILDPRQAKRLFAFIGAGGLLGSIAGGQIAGLATGLVDTRFALLVAAATLLAATGVIYLVQRHYAIDETPTEGAAGLSRLKQAQGGLAVIRGSRHLKLIALLMFLTITVANVVDVQFNWAMQVATEGLEGSERLDALTGGYGDFYTIMGVAALIFQLLFTARIHRRLGVAFAMRVLPITMGLGTMGLFLAATMLPMAMLTVCRVLKVGESGLRYSLDQATRELLFLPVPSRARLKAKAYIDVFVQRSGKAGAGILLLPVTFGLISVVHAGWISLVLIALWLMVTAEVYKEYVRAFRAGLTTRTVDATVPINLSDVTTLEILVESLGSVDRRQVLHSLELLSAHGRGNLVPPLLLYHDDARVRLKTLQVLCHVQRRDAVPLIERVVGDEDPVVRAEAIRTLLVLRGEDVGKMMLPRLRDADPGVRAAAVSSLANHPDEQTAREASSALADMVGDADGRTRAEAAKAIGIVRGSGFDGHLIQLLFDSESLVAGEAIAAVRRRLERDGFDAVYPPILISLMRNRRLKHESREALVAYGESVIPSLVHFMQASQESLWVRRALPKTIARIGSRTAIEALVNALEEPSDAFLRRKLIEALGIVTPRAELAGYRAGIQEAIRFDAKGYLQALVHLSGLGVVGKAQFEGPLIRWESEDDVPSLLDRLLAERMEDHLRNLFGLLALLHSPRPTAAAHRGLISGQPTLRSHALEYLDNILSGEERRNVFAVVGDTPLVEKFVLAKRIFGVHRRSKSETLRSILVAPETGAEEMASLRGAAVYTVYTDRVSELYSQVEQLLTRTRDSFVHETAAWVTARLKSSDGAP